MNIEQITGAIENTPARSAWAKGAKEYAAELAGGVYEFAAYCGKEPQTEGELEEYALNGAEDWAQYSYGGCGLICDSDIAARLCAPSELRRVRGGARRPNSQESWLDVQTRALKQAFRLLRNVWRGANETDN